MNMLKKSLLHLYAAFVFLSIGSYWIMSSWTVFAISNKPESISYLLIISSLYAFIVAPVLGVFVDYFGFRKVGVIGQSISLIAGLMPFFMTLNLYLMAFLMAISTTLTLASFERAIKFTIRHESLKRIRTSISIFQQCGLMLGTFIAGIMISSSLKYNMFAFISMISLINIFIYCYVTHGILPFYSAAQAGQDYFLKALPESIRYLINNRALLIAGGCITTAFLVAQIINVTLPIYIKLELNGDGKLFGICETAWALGGIIGAVIINILTSVFSNEKNENRLPLLTVFCLGICLLVLSKLNYSTHLVISVFLLIGILFNISKTLSDANLLAACAPQMIGRVRSVIVSFTSLVGIFVFSMPIIVSSLIPSRAYLYFGILIIFIISIMVFLNLRSRIATSNYQLTSDVILLKGMLPKPKKVVSVKNMNKIKS